MFNPFDPLSIAVIERQSWNLNVKPAAKKKKIHVHVVEYDVLQHNFSLP